MSYRQKALAFWLIGSVALGWLAEPLVQDLRTETGDLANLGSLSQNLGQGITVSTLGGYRTVTANFVWISMYGDWQYRRGDEVRRKMRLAVSLNPDSMYFWIDGSRIIANDMPVWEVGDARMNSLFESEEGIALRRAYGERALAFLDMAPARIKDEVEYLVERGSICWRRIGDIERALAYFREAVEKPDVPFYVCRVYAVLLEDSGRTLEAYTYLKNHYESLPDDNPAAMKSMVARRIRELERKL